MVFVLLGAGGTRIEVFGQGIGGAGQFAGGTLDEGIGAAGILPLGHVGDEVKNGDQRRERWVR